MKALNRYLKSENGKMEENQNEWSGEQNQDCNPNENAVAWGMPDQNLYAQQTVMNENIGQMNQNPYMQQPAQNDYMGQMNQNPYIQTGQKTPKKEEKNKTAMVVGIVVVVLVIGLIIGAAALVISLLGKNSGIATKQEKFTYSEGITVQDYVDTYYDGKLNQFEKDAKRVTYQDLMKESELYMKKVILVKGTIVSVDEKNHYVYVTENGKDQIVFLDAREDKSALKSGMNMEAYGTFYEVTTAKNGDQFPCCILWVANVEETKVAENVEKNTDTTSTNMETTQPKEAPAFFYEEGTPERELQDSIGYIEMDSDECLFLIIASKQEDGVFDTYAYLDTYVTFMDADDNIITVQNDASYIFPGQDSTLMRFYCYDNDYNFVSYDHYEVSCDIQIQDYEPKFTFDDVDFSSRADGDQISYEIKNKTSEDMYLEVIMVYMKDDKIVDYTWIAENIDAKDTVKKTTTGYYGEYDDYAYVFNLIE